MVKYNISLLYVEDEKILRSVYGRFLTDKIDKLFVAENGEVGLSLYRQHRPDLVITDIRMPVMNGLEMVKKIKQFDPSSRIIIMSAYGQPQYFMQAIEFGVKGFLLKPVNNTRLYDVIKEQSKEILLEKELHYQEAKRKKAEEAVFKSESILKAVSFAADKFLQLSFGEKSIPEVIEQLGVATQVSRVYIFENYTDKTGQLLTSQRYEWTAEGIDPQINNPALLNTTYEGVGFDRWATKLEKRECIFGMIDDLPESEQIFLQEQGIKSIVIVPVFANNQWWGFIGLDDCNKLRSWTTAELKALTTAAEIFGAAIHRKNVEEQLLKLNNELETRVELRTKDLKKEINERKVAEHMLRESEEKYRQIFENANDGILLTINGIIEFINPEIYEMTGYLPKECIGLPFVEFLPPEYKNLVLQNHIDRSNGLEVKDRYDIQILDKSGRAKWTEIKSTLIQWENVGAVLSFLTDITERKRNAEELEVLNYRLEQRVKEEIKKYEKQQQLLIQKSKLESLGELAAGIAHEINQPLGGISMGLDNALIKVREERASQEYLEKKFATIFEDIDRIRNIINHIRVFSKDQDVRDFEKIDVNEVIKNALGMVVTQYKNHNVNILLKLSHDVLFSYGNKYKLEQVILNLLSNAKYAIDEKETILNDGSFQKTICIASAKDGKEIKITLEDNGTGIPEKEQINIFDPFFTTKKFEIGTGLGLSISYGILKEMDGQISVDSKNGIYTKMIIVIPEFSKQSN
jgi:PAS domain S-box-containing protein